MCHMSGSMYNVFFIYFILLVINAEQLDFIRLEQTKATFPSKIKITPFS